MKLRKSIRELFCGRLTDVSFLYFLQRQAKRFRDMLIAMILVFDMRIDARQARIFGRLFMRMDDQLRNIGCRGIEYGVWELVLKSSANDATIRR